MSVFRQVKPSYLHPFMFILYSVAYLYVINIPYIAFEPLVLPLILFELGAVILLVAFYFMLRDMGLAAVFLSIVTILFFSYGRIFDLVQRSMCKTSFIPCGRHLYLILIWLGLIALTFAGMRGERIRAMADPINRYLVLVMAFLLIVTGVRLGTYLINRPQAPEGHAHWIFDPEDVPGKAPDPAPDIYYIILDEYTRQDVLLDYFGYDNAWFIEGLEERGFTITDESRSNYAQTFQSLSSSLNMLYIGNDLEGDQGGFLDEAQIIYEVRDNAAAGFLKGHGYQFIHMQTTYSVTADNPYADHLIKTVSLAPGQELLYDTTMLPGLLARTTNLFNSGQAKAMSINEGFSQLADLPDFESETPKFVFAHFLVPHDPYVFDAEGHIIPGKPREDSAGYVAQLTYTNHRILEIVDILQAESDVPPIIIVQGDHGSASTGWFDQRPFSDEFVFERTAILNAYYLPGYEGDALYETITPVNSFRLIFDAYFGTSFGLLDDRSYISRTDSEIQFDSILEH